MAAEPEEFLEDEELAEDQYDESLEEFSEVEDIEAEYIDASRPTTDASIIIQLVVGLIGTVVVALGVLPLKKTGVASLEYINGIINERGPVQYGEVFMAWMVAAMVFLKGRIVKRQLKSIGDSPVTHTVDLNNDQHLADIRAELRQLPSYHWSIVLNRIDRLLALWLGSKDIGRVAGWAIAESDRDATASDSSYSTSRVLIWAIPILGFIGTVLGLGAAVSGFSTFLKGATDLSAIKEAVGGGTSGLGTAFDTTLLALVLSVVLMFPLSSVQRKEETLFVEIDNYLDDVIISRLPSAEQQPIVIENLEDSIEAAFRRYIPDPDRYDEVFTRAIDRAAASVEEKFQSLASSYEATLNEASIKMSESITSAGGSVEHGIKTAVADLQAQDEKLVEARRAIATEESDRLRSMIQEVQTAAIKAAEDARQSADNLTAATQGSMDKALAASDAIAGRMEEVSRLASNIEDLLRIEESVKQSLDTIATSDEFKQTLANIREHLAATDEFCVQLSKPRIITFEEEVG